MSELKIKPRLYQEKIFANAVKENTLVVLPTGLGKTLIALMMSIQFLSKGKILFLAPTKPLIEQHKNSFIRDSCLTESDCVVISGLINPEERMINYSRKIIFATPQSIRNDVISRKLMLDDFSLIIFDECHRAVGDYAYVFLASNFKGRILGLSASPGSDDFKIKEVCANLRITHVESRSDNDVDVKAYLHSKKIKNINLELPDELKEIMKYLRRSLTNSLKELKMEGLFPDKDVNKIFKKDLLMLQGVSLKNVHNDASNYRIISLIAKALKINHALELLQTQGLNSLKKYFEQMKKQTAKASRELIREVNFQHAMSLVFNSNTDHPKFKALLELISKDKTFLVFTQYRETAELITNLINESGGNARTFVGQKNGMSQKKQLSILESFRKGDFNTLVSTSVSEEGLDIPSIDTAIFFEPVPSALRTVQRIGRVGRAKTGEVYVLVTNGTIDEKYKWVAHYKEKRMREVINNLSDNDLKQSRLNNFLN